MTARGRPSVVGLALRDVRHEARLSLVTLLGVVVALAPLVILLGLKLGVVEGLRSHLAADPRNLALSFRAGGLEGFDAAWFEAVAALPQTGFVIPATRRTVAHAILVNPATGEPVDVDLAPTAAGDPVLAQAGLPPPPADALVLSARAAQELALGAGATVGVLVRRSFAGRIEVFRRDMTVVGVLDAAFEPRSAAYAPLDFVTAVEDYREGQMVERYGLGGAAPLDDPFADFRLYARGLDDVEGLRDWLAARGVIADSAAADIARVRRIDADLTLVFAVVTTLSLFGFAATVALNQLAAVARKREALAVLRLLGYRGAALMAFPVAQGALLAGAGGLAALGVYYAVEPVFAALFADVAAGGRSLTRLPLGYALAIPPAAAVIAAAAGLFAGLQAARVDPSRELRHG